MRELSQATAKLLTDGLEKISKQTKANSYVSTSKIMLHSGDMEFEVVVKSLDKSKDDVVILSFYPDNFEALEYAQIHGINKIEIVDHKVKTIFHICDSSFSGASIDEGLFLKTLTAKLKSLPEVIISE